MMFNKRAMAALMAAGLVISGTASHEARADFFVDENGNSITEDASAFSDEYAESYEDYSGYTEEAADFGSGYSDAVQEDLFSFIEEEQSGDAAEEHKDGASNDAVSQYEAWLLSLGDYAVYYNEGKLPNSKIYDHDGQLLYDPEHPEESVLKEYEGVIEKEDSAAAQAESAAESTESEKSTEEAAADTAEEPAEKEEETAEAEEEPAEAAEEPAEAAEESAETEAPAEEAEAPAEVVEEPAEEAEVTEAPAEEAEAPAEVVEESAEEAEELAVVAEESAEVSEEPAEAAEDEAVFEGELKTSGVVLLVGASSDAKLVEDLITDETEVTETEEEPDLEAGSNDASYATSGASELVGDTSKVYTPSSGSSSSGKTTSKTETDAEEESDRPSSSEEAYTKQVGDETGDEEEAGDEADTDEEAAEDETEEVTDEEEEAEDAETDLEEEDSENSSGGNIKGKSPSTADASPILPYTAASVMSFAAGIWAALGFGRKKED